MTSLAADNGRPSLDRPDRQDFVDLRMGGTGELLYQLSRRMVASE